MPNQKFESGWAAFQEFREWSGGLPGGSGVVGRPSRRSASGQEALPEVRETLPEDRMWSEDTTKGPRVDGRPTRRSGNGLKALPKVHVWSRGPPGSPGVV